MATCKDCVHLPVCDALELNGISKISPSLCGCFQNKADVAEVRHAYWKETTHTTISKRNREIHSKLYNCSYCNAPNGRKKSSFCHWCGAKMDGKRRDT